VIAYPGPTWTEGGGGVIFPPSSTWTARAEKYEIEYTRSDLDVPDFFFLDIYQYPPPYPEKTKSFTPRQIPMKIPHPRRMMPCNRLD
jgi:hypothetical protein